jgi:DNA-binding SARP family transcriptional activator/TolB-like protein
MVNSETSIEIMPLQGRYSLQLLGGFELLALPGGAKPVLPGKRERALLAYLALSPKGRQPRRKLAALLWGDAADETLLDNLRTCVWRLRKALGHGAHRLLASDEDDIVLDLAAFDIDVLTFRRLAGGAGRADLVSAARLLGGDLLGGLELDSEEFESWRRMEGLRHLDQAVDVLSRLMRLYADSGEAERAIDAGAKILRLDPLHEATARHMMKLYAANGRRGAALQLYQALAEALKRDVNAQPEPATREVFAAIIRAEKDMAAQALVETSVETPIDAPIVVSLPPNAARDAPAEPQPIPQPPHKWRLAALAAALIAMTALASHWWVVPARPAATPAAGGALFPAATPLPAANQATPVTIAVLSFDNLSGNTGLQSFSDGIGEEISAALGKMAGLQLVARDSAFQLKRATDTRGIGMTPLARYLVEGTVRLTQNRIIVAARLIRTDTGAAIWNESYDRELNDISTVRTDIAMAIAEALNTPLGLAPQMHSGSDPNIDANSYEQFQHAQSLMRTRYTGAKEAADILESLVKRNPNYAPAWAALAQCYAWMPGFASPYDVPERHRRIQIFFPMAQEAAHRAIALDPKLAEPYLTLSHIEAFNGRWAAALDIISKALVLHPDLPAALANQMGVYAILGYRKEALAIAERLRTLEPDNVGFKQDTAEVMWENGQADAPIEVLKSLIDRPSGPTSLAMMYASVGRYQDAAEVLETALKGPGTLPDSWPESFRIAAGLLRKAPSKTVFPADPPHLDRVGFVYLYVGAPQHAFDNYEDWIKSGQVGGQGDSFSYVWNASYSPARKTQNFKQFARDAGFVAYWRQRGWPDLCHPVGVDDFACD